VKNSTGTVEEINNYYPSGALFTVPVPDVQDYKYSGKELGQTQQIILTENFSGTTNLNQSYLRQRLLILNATTSQKRL